MKDLESAESKKNLISDLWDFYFSSPGDFLLKIIPFFDKFSPITWKIKIGKKMYFVFNSIQHIPHLS